MKMNTTRVARWTATAAVAALAIGATGLSAQAAYAADEPAFPLYDETDSPNPFNVTDGLVFYKAADMGWQVNVPIAEVESLAYTVAEGTSYAPAFQLVTKSDQKEYARITWEAYQNGADAETGAYTDLEDGKWWSNKITSGRPGSQSAPQPLSFFTDGGGAGWTNVVVGAIALHQGTTTESTSTVTSLSFNGTAVPLGNPDTTPFDQAAVDARVDEATTPLESQLIAKDAQITDLQGQLEAKTAELAEVQADLAAVSKQVIPLQNQVIDLLMKNISLTSQVASLNSQITTLTSQVASLKSQVSSLTTYKNTHHTADGTYIGWSRALLSSNPVAGRTVGVTKLGTLATATNVKYQWYLSGKAVSGATKSTYAVPSSAKGKSVSVKVWGTTKYISYSVQSNTINAR